MHVQIRNGILEQKNKLYVPVNRGWKSKSASHLTYFSVNCMQGCGLHHRKVRIDFPRPIVETHTHTCIHTYMYMYVTTHIRVVAKGDTHLYVPFPIHIVAHIYTYVCNHAHLTRYRQQWPLAMGVKGLTQLFPQEECKHTCIGQEVATCRYHCLQPEVNKEGPSK